MHRRSRFPTWVVLVTAISLFLVGCEDLKRLRELRDQATFGAAGLDPEADPIAIDDGPPPLPDTGPVDRDTGVAEDAGTDSIFIPVDDARDTGPTFDEPPLILAVYPPAGPADEATIVTVEGARFTWDIEVRLGGELVPRVDVVDEYEFLFVTEPMEPGTYDLKVSTGGGVALYENAFTYLEPLSVSGVEPESGPVSGGLPLTVTGSGFAPSTRFVFGDRAAEDVRILSSGEAEMLLPPSDARGPVTVMAVGSGFTRLNDGFLYTERPELQALLPAVGSTFGGESLRVTGNGISEGCTLVFGAGEAVVERSEIGWLEVQSPGGAPGPADVAVDCGEAGLSYHREAFEFVAADAEQGVRSVWPETGFSRGGALVTLSGVGLDAVDDVYFGAILAPTVQQSEFAIEVVAPAAAAGEVDIALTSDAEELLLTDAFTYVDAPIFDAASPSSGPLAGGWESTLVGAGLDVVDELVLDGRVLEESARGEGGISFQTNPAAGGASDLYARVAGLAVDTGIDLHFRDEVAFDGFSPRSGVATGGTPVYLTGTGFTAGCTVLVEGEPVPTEVVNSFVIVATTPPHEPGWAPVSVIDCADTEWVSPREFQYFDPSLPPGGVGGGDILGEVNVAVIEAGSNAPIEGATVQVRVRSSSPYVALTDERGQVTFTGDDLVGEQTVTAYAEGRSAETYVNVNARSVTLVLNPMPPPPCDPAVEDCTPPPIPVGTVIGFLTGLTKLGDPPPGARVGARVETSRYSHNFGNPNPGPEAVLYENGGFTINTRLGEFALIAQCGWFLEDGSFVPTRIGVERGVFIREADPAYRTSIDCNIPLSESATFKLTDAPALVDAGPESPESFPAFYQVTASFDLGADGVFETLPPIITSDALFTGGAFPAFEGPFETANVDFEATALDLTQRFPYVMSFVRGANSWDRVITFPSMMPLPELVTPSEEDPYLIDGYVEWDYDEAAPAPDFFYFSVSGASETFPRWGVFVPGHQRDLNLADFPEFRESIGWVPSPGSPGTVMVFYIRAIDREVFDFDEFDRYALRSSGWRSVAVNYQSVTLLGDGGDIPDEDVEAP